jgi:hypothetical protein
VMAVWAVAWAGSKPFASLLDGFLATELGVRWTGVILALPALLPAVLLLLAPSLGKRLADIRRDRGQKPPRRNTIREQERVATLHGAV